MISNEHFEKKMTMHADMEIMSEIVKACTTGSTHAVTTILRAKGHVQWDDDTAGG